MKASDFSEGAIKLFREIVLDAADWSGNPGPNLDFTKEEKGYLTKLKTAGVLTTMFDEGINWVVFKKPAIELAAELNMYFESNWVA